MGSRTPDADLQGFTERNEYKAAFMECVQYIQDINTIVQHSLGHAVTPLSSSCLALITRVKAEEEERLRASFNHYLSNFTESEILAMKEMGLIGNVYENP